MRQSGLSYARGRIARLDRQLTIDFRIRRSKTGVYEQCAVKHTLFFSFLHKAYVLYNELLSHFLLKKNKLCFAYICQTLARTCN